MTIKELLTKEQADFLKKHKISEELLFDAEGAGISEDLKRSMSEADKVIAYNIAGCNENEEHRFSTIAGVCPQCNPASVAAALREYKPGYIYIAGSKRGSLIKVGSANETKSRVITINFSGSKYAGYDDWELLYQAKTVTIGKVERMFQQKLVDYKSSYEHEKSGKIQNGGELYRCSYNKAKEAITALLEDQEFELAQISEKRHITAEYQFKNLKARTEPVLA